MFVDTGAWFASIVPTDPDYERAFEWLKQNNELLLTTDYIVDETLTLLRARGEQKRALMLGEQFFDGALTQVVYRLSREDLEQAWKVFRNYKDKDWSFTDCTSKVIIKNLQITTAFAFDHHFRQFGTVTVVPPEE